MATTAIILGALGALGSLAGSAKGPQPPGVNQAGAGAAAQYTPSALRLSDLLKQPDQPQFQLGQDPNQLRLSQLLGQYQGM